MFEFGRRLKMEPHFCYEYLDRCSCMACMFMSDKHAIENMLRYPEQIEPIRAGGDKAGAHMEK